MIRCIALTSLKHYVAFTSISFLIYLFIHSFYLLTLCIFPCGKSIHVLAHIKSFVSCDILTSNVQFCCRESRVPVGPRSLYSCKHTSWTGYFGHIEHFGIGVGAQSTLGGHKIFARKICIKNQQNARILRDSCPKIIKIPEFLWYMPEKFTKFPNFTWFCPKKCPNFT